MAAFLRQNEELHSWLELGYVARINHLAATLSEERTNMKNTPSVSKITDPAKSILAPSREGKDKSPVESLDLSPERLTERASTATKVLHNFLDRDDRTHYLRHWGLNE